MNVHLFDMGEKIMPGGNGPCQHKGWKFKKVSEGEHSALKMFLLLIFFMSQLQKEVGSDLGSLKLLLSS